MRIYVSSTSIDLAEHRQAVTRVLRQMGHDVVGMEEYVAEAARPIERCLRDVEHADLLIGIFAWRYGFIPSAVPAPATVLPPETTIGETSITEFEWRKAAEGCRLAFLLDPNADWPVHHVDAVNGEGKAGQKIAAFRGELAGSELVAFFRTPHDLAREVAAAVHLYEIRNRLHRLSSLLQPGLAMLGNINIPADESTSLLLDLARLGSDSEVVVVDLGAGQNWWSTRLYLLADIAKRYDVAQAVLFTDRGQVPPVAPQLPPNPQPGSLGRFVGIVRPGILRRRMLDVHPPLARLEEPAPGEVPAPALLPPLDPRAGIQERFDHWRAVMNAIGPGGEQQFAIPVTSRRLHSWLGEYLNTHAVEEYSGPVPSPQFLQQAIEYPGSYVPTVRNRSFSRVINRAALVDQLARMFVNDFGSVRL